MDDNQRINLNGLWRFCADRGDNGADRGFTLADFDDGPWRTATVPGTFEMAGADLFGYVGAAWYRRKVDVPALQGRRALLQFGAVNYHCAAWVNGRPAGGHDAGYLPFALDVTDCVRPGENTLALRVDSRLWGGQLPPEHFWRGPGGILRDVELRLAPPVRLAGVWVDAAPRPGGSAALRVQAAVVNDTSQDVECAVAHDVAGLTLAGAMTVPPGGRAELTLTAALPDARLWSPDAPHLYSLDTALSAGPWRDESHTRFGVRSVAVEGGQVTLNGKPVFLRGFNRHEDSPVTGIAADAAASRADFEAIKASGANFVRFCHYPHSPVELDLCDELGLLVMDEIALNALLVNVPGVDLDAARRCLPQTYQNAREALRRLVARDYNHPCVIFWSVGNETNEQHAEVREMNDALVRQCKALDPTRLSVHVSQGCHWYGELADKLFAQDDVICVNAYVTMEGRMYKRNKAYSAEEAAAFWRFHRARLAALYPGKPVLVSEYGYPTDLAFEAGEDEEAQARAIESDYSAMAGHVCGACLWIFADHAWPCQWPSLTPLYGGYISRYGVMTRERKPKKAWETVKRLFSGPPPGGAL